MSARNSDSDWLSSACKVVVRHITSFADSTNAIPRVRRFKVGQQQWEIHSHPKHSTESFCPWTPEKEQTASVRHWLTPFWREPEWREREIERVLATVGERVVSYWPVMQCGRAEWWRVECRLHCFYSSSLACLITKLCRLSRSRPPWCSSPCSPALKMIKVG